MLACSRDLAGECDRSSEECRFSHGSTISLDDVGPFEEPDWDALTVGAKCLAKGSDGIWRPARLIKAVPDLYGGNERYVRCWCLTNVCSSLKRSVIFLPGLRFGFV